MRAAGVALLGEMPGSGYRQPPLLVRRRDGQTFQLTPLLYTLLGEIDGARGWEELADAVSSKCGRTLTALDVVYLIAVKLRPLGLLREPDGSEPATRRVNPLLGLRFRLGLCPPLVTKGMAALVAWTFHPLVAVPVLAGFVAVCWWALVTRGMGSAVEDALYNPELVLAIVALTVVSAAFHELGHAAAARYGGAEPGRMGAALYLLWPVFFTDVTDSYRLSRAGRLRVDLGGLYFNAIFVVATFVAWGATRSDGLLVMVPIQLLQMGRQLIPLVRFDGYHILADLTGVPDLFARIRPVLLGVIPFRHTPPEAQQLKPSARAVVTAWVVVTAPTLLALFAGIVWQMPRVAVAAWHSLGAQAETLRESLDAGATARVALGFIAMLAVALAPATMAYVTTRIVRHGTVRAWALTEDRPFVRGATCFAVVGLALAVLPSWWPRAPERDATRGRDRPGESTVAPLTDLGDLAVAAVSRTGDRSGLQDTREGAELAGDAGAGSRPSSPEVALPGTTERGSWPFPFDPPPPPGAQDNQAVAVNTWDQHVEVATAFDLVRTSADAVFHRNRAYAYASCVNCRTVAVAFQVVIATELPSVVSPQNLAISKNYECEACSTRAVAVQLAMALTRPLDSDVNAQLNTLYRQATALRERVRDMPAEEIRSRLLAIKAEMTALLDPYATPIETQPDPQVRPEPFTDPAGTTDGTSTTSTTSTTSSSTTTTTSPSSATSSTSTPSTTTTSSTSTTSPSSTTSSTSTTTTTTPSSSTTTSPPA